MLYFYCDSIMEDAAGKHLEYLISILKAPSEPEEHKSLHSLYVDLNKLAGMYWIVCSCFLLENLNIDLKVKVSQLKEVFNQQLDSQLETHPIIFNENGGPLRTLSVVQLLALLKSKDEAHELFEKLIKPQLSDFLQNSIISPLESNLPFWFDMRGIYCLCASLKLIDAMELISEKQRSSIVDFIYRSQAILGGFGARVDSEAHGGYTFCAVGTLRLLGADIPNKHRLTVWLQKRLDDMNGRVGKLRDSCYIWWVGASLSNIDRLDLLNKKREILESFLLKNCFCYETGGISKYPSIPFDEKSVHGKQEGDLFHTFLGICSHSLFAGTIDPITVLPNRQG